jgi:hypothetical protein
MSVKRSGRSMRETSRMLASDRERQATVLRLQAAHLEGRLDTDELEDRVGRAQAARTRADLDAIEADLPRRPAVGLDVTTGVPRLPGNRHFVERKLLHAPPDEIREQALVELAPALERYRYVLQEDEPGLLVFRGGLHRIHVRLTDAGDRRTLVIVHGVAPLAVRRAFARLAD